MRREFHAAVEGSYGHYVVFARLGFHPLLFPLKWEFILPFALAFSMDPRLRGGDGERGR